jgi:hypothetical protein
MLKNEQNINFSFWEFGEKPHTPVMTLCLLFERDFAQSEKY